MSVGAAVGNDIQADMDNELNEYNELLLREA